MKTSFTRIQLFAAAADRYLKRNAGETKPQYAIKRVMDQAQRHQDRIKEQLTDIEIECCVVDEKEVIKRDEFGNLCYTREGLRERNRRQKELLEREDLELAPHYLATTPEGATPDELAAFAGFILVDISPLEMDHEQQEEVTTAS